MKIQLVSDLHLEFAPINIENTGSDLLILSGDICVAKYLKTEGQQGQKFRDFFKQVSQNFDRVLYVLGNHEHYNGKFESTAEIVRRNLPDNITLLDNEAVTIEGYRFVGGTLWTKMNPIEEPLIEGGLNDFHIIKYGDNYRKLRVTDTYKPHDQLLRLIDLECAKNPNVVVIGHHAPSFASVTEEYKNNRYSYLNPAYCTELSEFILDHPQIRLWTHGHVHSSHDYKIGNTRIVANPRGYNNENKGFDPGLILEI